MILKTITKRNEIRKKEKRLEEINIRGEERDGRVERCILCSVLFLRLEK